jgi:SNF2 family DNA or RNA helicase
MSSRRPCGPIVSNKNPDAYNKEELIEQVHKKFGYARSRARSFPKLKLCEMLKHKVPTEYKKREQQKSRDKAELARKYEDQLAKRRERDRARRAAARTQEAPSEVEAMARKYEEQLAKRRERDRARRARSRSPAPAAATTTNDLARKHQEQLEKRRHRDRSRRAQARGEIYDPIKYEEKKKAQVKITNPTAKVPQQQREAAKIDMGVKLDMDRPCVDKPNRLFPNRYTKPELVNLAIQELGMFKTHAKKKEIKELCEELKIPYTDLKTMMVPYDPNQKLPKAKPQPVPTPQTMLMPYDPSLAAEQLAQQATFQDWGEQPECITKSLKPLKPHQQNVITALRKRRGIIAIHDVGTGKTLTAVTAANCFLSANPKNRVIVITPASVVDNFKKEMKAYGSNPEDPKYSFFTYQDFLLKHSSSQDVCSNTMLIIDEAHNLRNSEGKQSTSVLKCAQLATKVLLLTATPVINTPFDILVLMAMLDPKYIPVIAEGETKFNNAVKNASVAQIKDMFKCNISFYIPSTTEKLKDYPRVNLQTHYFEMSPEYYQQYLDVENNSLTQLKAQNPQVFSNYAVTEKLDAFYNGVRRAANDLQGDQGRKFSLIKDLLSKRSEFDKFVIYSNFLTSGVQVLYPIIKDLGLTFETIDGDLIQSKRQAVVDRYNNNQINVLFITKAGGEGLNLKGTTDLIILEPYWNQSLINQVIGRAVRYQSHQHLPMEKRVVNIHQLFTIKPSEAAKIAQMGQGAAAKLALSDFTNFPERLSVDLFLSLYAKQKQQYVDDFVQKLQQASIEQDQECGIVPVEIKVKQELQN